jgi:hypothetical protein
MCRYTARHRPSAVRVLIPRRQHSRAIVWAHMQVRGELLELAADAVTARQQDVVRV